MTPGRGRRPAIVAAAALAALAACSPAEPARAGPDLDALLAARPAEKLSDYGLFLDAGARQPAERVVAYDLVNPLFSDHADKRRFVFVPEGETAGYRADGVFDFPVGSTLVKTFAFGERYLETRLLVRQEAGWVALPYVWNTDQTEATYAPVGATLAIDAPLPDGSTLAAWSVPNRNQCKTCHQAGDDISPIGPSARNLNHVGPAGRPQLADWAGRGLLDLAPDDAPVMARADDAAAPLELRARAYLDVNCAHCHKADGSASNSGLFLDYGEERPALWGVGKLPVAAGRGATGGTAVIEPGAAGASILLLRMESVEPGVAMPELGRSVRHEEGIALIRDWIAGMEPSPDRAARGG